MLMKKDRRFILTGSNIQTELAPQVHYRPHMSPDIDRPAHEISRHGHAGNDCILESRADKLNVQSEQLVIQVERQVGVALNANGIVQVFSF